MNQEQLKHMLILVLDLGFYLEKIDALAIEYRKMIFLKRKPKDFINEVKNIYGTDTTKALIFIRISLFSTKNYFPKSVHQLLNYLLSTESSIFLYEQCFH